MRYEDVTIEIADSTLRTENGQRVGSCTVRVLRSPAGAMPAAQSVKVEYDDKALQLLLGKLDRRQLDRAALIGLGRALAKILLPTATSDDRPGVRELFARSLAMAGPDNGVRLRLHLPPELSVVPWEFVYVDRAGGEGMDGFIALDPRIAVVRDEMLDEPVTPPLLTGDIQVVTAVAAAEGLPELDLDAEMEYLNRALGELPGIEVKPCASATLAKLLPLLVGAGVFHFAGHGDFRRELGARPGTYTGTGFLAFENERVGAEQFSINLRGNGVRVAVLAGCETGRRDGVSVWSGIAPALAQAGIPAVVANQYSILDKCAIAFSRQFYQALAGGLPIERAVAAGRIAAYNADTNGRDWGVPVLYMRAADGNLFAGATDPAAREAARHSAEADVVVRVKQVKAGGVLVGADVERMLEGKLQVAVDIAGSVFGKATGANLGQVEGGTIRTRMNVDEIGEGGCVTGVKIDTLGFASRSSGQRPAGGTSRPADSSGTGKNGKAEGKPSTKPESSGE